MSNDSRKSIGGPATAPEDTNRLRDARRHAIRVRAERKAEGTAVRDRSSELTGGLKLKLAVAGEIPGYHLYWENDQDGAVETLLMEGFDFVSYDELRAGKATEVVEDADIGSQISRYVGRREDGDPLRAYLLKCPNDLWQERQENSLVEADRRDADIRRRVEQVQSGEYVPTGYKSSLDTRYKKAAE